MKSMHIGRGQAVVGMDAPSQNHFMELVRCRHGEEQVGARKDRYRGVDVGS